MEQQLLCEDYITDFVFNNHGLVITRKKNNLENFNYKNINPLVCITGYHSIISKFFNEIIHHFIYSITLIIIESDDIRLTEKWLDNEKLKTCFTWNKPFEHNKLVALPIGFNYARHNDSLTKWLHNIDSNYINNFQQQYLKSITTKKKDIKPVAINYSTYTNPIRSFLINKATTDWKNICNIINFIAPIHSYKKKSYIEGEIRINVTNPICYDILRKYKFILSPRGAGEDTHRTWESLLVGCIPIVFSSMLNELYDELPVVIVNDWNDINETYLNNKFNEIVENVKENKYNFQKLFLDYWLQKIRNFKLHFMTYADNNFSEAMTRLTKEAFMFGEFNTINPYCPNDIPVSIKNKFIDILSQKRGGGYWLWRPFILLQQLNKIEDGDIIVYLDAGCMLNIKGKDKFWDYVNKINKSKYGSLSFQMTGLKSGSLAKEKEWTTDEIFKHFKIDINNKEITETGQFLGGIFLLKKNKDSMKYVNDTIKCILSNPYLITDVYNKNQKSYFKDNRHEQSVTSIIRKLSGTEIIDNDDSWIVPFGSELSLKYPFWATRSKR